MVKRLLVVLTISVSLFIGLSNSSAKSTDCEHYFERVSINNVTYLIEYSCDGSIVAATVIDD